LDARALAERADAVRDYIRDIVWRMLDRPVQAVEHLGVIIDGCVISS
jgi:hypothetical protein